MPNSKKKRTIIRCPSCRSKNVIKHGKTAQGKQRFLCRQTDCNLRTFIVDYTYRGCLPETKQKVSQLVNDGRGIRDTARRLKISVETVVKEVRKVAN